MAVDGKVELFMAVHVDGIVIAGSDERREYFHVAIVVKFRTNNDGKLTWYIRVGLSNAIGDRALEIPQKAFIESMMDGFGVTSVFNVPATPSVELGPKKKASRGGGRLGV